MTTFALLVCAAGSVICSAAVVVQSRIIKRLVQSNAILTVALQSIFVEAVWPPHDEKDSA